MIEKVKNNHTNLRKTIYLDEQKRIMDYELYLPNTTMFGINWRTNTSLYEEEDRRRKKFARLLTSQSIIRVIKRSNRRARGYQGQS